MTMPVCDQYHLIHRKIAPDTKANMKWDGCIHTNVIGNRSCVYGYRINCMSAFFSKFMLIHIGIVLSSIIFICSCTRMYTHVFSVVYWSSLMIRNVRIYFPRRNFIVPLVICLCNLPITACSILLLKYECVNKRWPEINYCHQRKHQMAVDMARWVANRRLVMGETVLDWW